MKLIAQHWKSESEEDNSDLQAFEVETRNFLDGFLHHPWPRQWSRGGGGEESLQKPCKKVFFCSFLQNLTDVDYWADGIGRL